MSDYLERGETVTRIEVFFQSTYTHTPPLTCMLALLAKAKLPKSWPWTVDTTTRDGVCLACGQKHESQ